MGIGAPQDPWRASILCRGQALLTAASHGIPVAVFLLRDRELAQIAQFQRAAFNRRTTSTLPDFHAGSLAEAVGVEWLALDRDEEIESVLRDAHAVVGAGRPVLVDVAIDYGEKTWFTRGVVRTSLVRLPWPDRLRFIFRAVTRRLTKQSGISQPPR